MKNGLWKVSFRTQIGDGEGVVVLRDGRLLGGDSAMSYVGDYELQGDRLKVTVNINRHSDSSGQPSVLGTDRATLVITGPVSGDHAALVGTSPAAPGVELQVFLEFIAA